MEAKLNYAQGVLPEKLMALREVSVSLGVCARTIRRLVDKGEFPKPVKVGRCVRFVPSEVFAYVNRLKERRV